MTAHVVPGERCVSSFIVIIVLAIIFAIRRGRAGGRRECGLAGLRTPA